MTLSLSSFWISLYWDMMYCLLRSFHLPYIVMWVLLRWYIFFYRSSHSRALITDHFWFDKFLTLICLVFSLHLLIKVRIWHCFTYSGYLFPIIKIAWWCETFKFNKKQEQKRYSKGIILYFNIAQLLQTLRGRVTFFALIIFVVYSVPTRGLPVLLQAQLNDKHPAVALRHPILDTITL